MEKQEELLARPQMNKNQRKTTFPREGKLKNAENHSSLVSEMQKMQKIMFRLQATGGKR